MDIKQIKVLGKRVLIELDPQTTQTKGGIIIPDDKVKKSISGKIVNVGNQVSELNPGDKVIFGERIPESNRIKVGEKDLVFVHEGDVFTKVG